jgi:hypothetical protein
LKSIHFIQPRLAPDVLKTKAIRIRAALTTSLEGRPLPAIEVWGSSQVEEQMRQFPPLVLRYHPDDLPDGGARLDRIESNRRHYDEKFRALHGKILFVGMSV